MNNEVRKIWNPIFRSKQSFEKYRVSLVMDEFGDRSTNIPGTNKQVKFRTFNAGIST